MKILHVDSSIQGEQSISRKLSAAIVERLSRVASPASVVYRDLASDPVPQFSPALAKVAAGLPLDHDDPAQGDVAAIGQVLEEVLEADTLVIGAPMYNFTVPTQLKSWLDAMVVPGRTFRYGAAGVEGLLGGKRVIIASSRGGFYGPETPSAAVEHQESYLRGLLGFLGISDIEVVRAEGVRMGAEAADKAINAALAQAAELQAA